MKHLSPLIFFAVALYSNIATGEYSVNPFGGSNKTDIKAEKYIMESTKFDCVVESIGKHVFRIVLHKHNTRADANKVIEVVRRSWIKKHVQDTGYGEFKVYFDNSHVIRIPPRKL